MDEIREYGEARVPGEIEQELGDGSYRVWLVRRVYMGRPGQPGDPAFGHPHGEGRTMQMAVKLVIEPFSKLISCPARSGSAQKDTAHGAQHHR